MRNAKLDHISSIPESDTLAGAWRVARDIYDHRAELKGHFEGHARFTPAEGDVLQYQEEGRLTYGAGQIFDAERRYIWRRVPEGWQVDFDDSRPFHLIRAADHRARHDCAPDLYILRYQFDALPRQWQCQCRITGPRKDLDLVTTYYRD